jgi:ferredoxin
MAVSGEGRPPHGIRVSIDWVRCTGLGLCIALAPDAFLFDADEEVATVRDAEAVDRDILFAAARSCPREAIYLDTADGHPLYP